MDNNKDEKFSKHLKELSENVEELKKELNALKDGSYITGDWIDNHSLSKTLNITPRTLTNFVRQRLFKVTKMGRTNYFKKAEILNFLEDNHKYYTDDTKLKKPD